MNTTAKITAGLVALLAVGAVAAPSSATEAPATPTTVSAPADPTPIMTVSQENAVEEAEFLLEYGSYSREQLLDELARDGYSDADAEYAITHLESTGGVDWYDEAVQEAEFLLEYGSYSREQLIDELERDGFTTAQVEYAVDAVGLTA